MAFNAIGVDGQRGWKSRLREIAARVKMWLDMRLLHIQPRHLCVPQALPE